MAITPIETAAFVPKSQEASFQKQTEVQRPVHEQTALGAAMDQKQKMDSTRTIMLAKSDQPEYRYDGSSGNGKGMLYKKGGMKKKNRKEQENLDKEKRGFDIRI